MQHPGLSLSKGKQNNRLKMALSPQNLSLRAGVRFGLFIKMRFFAKLISTFWKGVRPLWKSQLLAFLCSTEGEASGLLPKPIQGINMFLHFAVFIFYPNHSQKEQSGNKTERNDLILSNQILDAAKVNSNTSSTSIQKQIQVDTSSSPCARPWLWGRTHWQTRRKPVNDSRRWKSLLFSWQSSRTTFYQSWMELPSENRPLKDFQIILLPLIDPLSVVYSPK